LGAGESSLAFEHGLARAVPTPQVDVMILDADVAGERTCPESTMALARIAPPVHTLLIAQRCPP